MAAIAAKDVLLIVEFNDCPECTDDVMSETIALSGAVLSQSGGLIVNSTFFVRAAVATVIPPREPLQSTQPRVSVVPLLHDAYAMMLSR